MSYANQLSLPFAPATPPAPDALPTPPEPSPVTAAGAVGARGGPAAVTLPDDLLAYGMHPYDPPCPYILWPLEPVGVSFCFSTRARNIEAAREFVVIHEAAQAAEQARREAEAARPKRRKKAASG